MSEMYKLASEDEPDDEYEFIKILLIYMILLGMANNSNSYIVIVFSIWVMRTACYTAI